MLTRNGWAIDEVADGQSAVSACRQMDYKLVLLDIRMPGISGHQAARQIAQYYESIPDSKTPRPWLVAVTGTDRKDKEDFTAFDAYLQKPFTLTELNACLNSFLLGKG